MKVGDEVRITKGTSPLYGREGRVVVVGPSATWVMVDLGSAVERVDANECTALVRSNGHVARKTKE